MNLCPVTKKIIYASHAKARNAYVTVKGRKNDNMPRHSFYCRGCKGYHFGRDPGTAPRQREAKRARQLRQELSLRDIEEDTR